ncbi:papain fold toxin domain-containing protein [Roseofilum capinflatum]|uniref:Papain fold toxin domain-containing protein n=1 Tax=Roseofilum capinflatum BLCC-M114 TaxID=3022440 RepID=A0ABT7B223_9CYAN|nr:papain fold toxin domain-containing protein [Roseofilum capinflatum]MDJ1173217.1 papain fold toxin domain-containing protein [Roseofilum capinflatum BLCC-M114]
MWQEVGKMVITYPLMECDRCAIAVMAWLAQQGIAGKILRLQTKRPSEIFIISRRYTMNESITENGTHYGVEVLGLVFDNLSEYGLPRSQWIADFMCPSGQFLIDELEYLGDENG